MAACTCVTEYLEKRAAVRRSRQIDEQLRQDRRRNRQQITCLLLGPSQSGKSTFIKHVRLLYSHGADYSLQDRLEFRHTIYHNMLKGTKILAEARRRLQIPLQDPRNDQNGQIISSYHREGELTDEEFHPYVAPLGELWRDAGVQSTLERSGKFHWDSLSYFMKHLDRVGTLGYKPSNEDLLHCYIPTEGVHQYTLDIQAIPFLFIDTGPMRIKQLQWFDDITAIIFFVPSNAFDQTLEDCETNYLKDAVNSFDTVVNSRVFHSVFTILIFNKMDLLTEKLKEKNVKDYFPQFQGNPHDLRDVQDFLVNMFESVKQDETTKIYHHFTTATACNTGNNLGRVVFNIIKDEILTAHLVEIQKI